MHAFLMHIYVYTHTPTMCLSLIKLLTYFSTLWNRVQGSKQTKLDYELLCRTTDLVSAGRKDRSTCCRISSVQSLSCVQLFVNCSTPGLPVHHQLPEFTQTHVHRVVMPSSHLILCRPLLFLPPIPPSIRVFSNESALRMRWPKYWSFSFSISPSNEHPRLVSFRMDWLDLLAVQGTLQESSPTPQFKSINSLALSFLHSPTLTSIHDH